ncbi:putative lipoprotein LppJ [Mycolicibacterium duvalii]|uniref:Putative lipoprotein LppJ n=2 Tax=Mycolicibacterium duvalii TaxID=39688 RepID=A0A7I7K3U6_9MYCO|nr:putative lipoprotein LppJ [Mycolicibacterium duvalii]
MEITRLLAPLLIVFALGGCGMSESVPAQDNPFDAPQDALSDEQARAQVVDPAVAVVRAVPLDDVTGGFSFGSCNDQGEPPFQGRVEVTFRLPADPEPVYAQIRDALLAQGWTGGAPDGQVVHGASLHRDGVKATVGPRALDPGYGSLQFYGECGNTGEHGAEGAVDITGELR